MKPLLYVTTSVRGEASRTKALADGFIREISKSSDGLKITHRDVGVKPPAHPDHAYTIANYTREDQRTDAMRQALAQSDELIGELQSHDWYVLSVPMYNYSVSSAMKAWIDNIVRNRLTFSMKPGGSPTGLLKNKKVLVVTTRGLPGYADGGPLSDCDHLEPYLRSIFGMMGVFDMTFVNVEGLNFAGEDEIEAALEAGRHRLRALAREWM